MNCNGCQDYPGKHLHCPLCDNYALVQKHDNACPLRKKEGR